MDSVWHNQHSECVRINGYSWSPDHAFDGGMQEAELLTEGLRITIPISSSNGARSVDKIRVRTTDSSVETNQRADEMQKTGVDSRHRLVGIVDNLAMVEFFRGDSTQCFPDGNLGADVYT